MPEPTVPTLSYRFARFTFSVFFRIWFRWKVLHRERVPAEGGVILASNHVSYLDPVYVVSALERMVVGWRAKVLLTCLWAAASCAVGESFPWIKREPAAD